MGARQDFTGLNNMASQLIEAIERIDGTPPIQLDEFNAQTLQFFSLAADLRKNPDIKVDVDLLLNSVNKRIKRKSRTLSKYYKKMHIDKAKIITAGMTTVPKPTSNYSPTTTQSAPGTKNPIKPVQPRVQMPRADAHRVMKDYEVMKDKGRLYDQLKIGIFVQPESRFTGNGYKVHIGFTFPGRRYTEDGARRYAEILADLSKLLEKHRDQLAFKYAGFALAEAWTKIDVEQRGKQVTIYVPEEHKEIIPVLLREIDRFIAEKRKEGYRGFVASNPDRNTQLTMCEGQIEGSIKGVVSIRYSSAFGYANGDKAAKTLDDWERKSAPNAVLRRAGKIDEFNDIEKRIKNVVDAAGVTRDAVMRVVRKAYNLYNSLPEKTQYSYAGMIQSINRRLVGTIALYKETDSNGETFARAGIIKEVGPYKGAWLVKMEMLDGRNAGQEVFAYPDALSNNLHELVAGAL